MHPLDEIGNYDLTLSEINRFGDFVSLVRAEAGLDEALKKISGLLLTVGVSQQEVEKLMDSFSMMKLQVRDLYSDKLGYRR